MRSKANALFWNSQQYKYKYKTNGSTYYSDPLQNVMGAFFGHVPAFCEISMKSVLYFFLHNPANYQMLKRVYMFAWLRFEIKDKVFYVILNLITAFICTCKLKKR